MLVLLKPPPPPPNQLLRTFKVWGTMFIEVLCTVCHMLLNTTNFGKKASRSFLPLRAQTTEACCRALMIHQFEILTAKNNRSFGQSPPLVPVRVGYHPHRPFLFIPLSSKPANLLLINAAPPLMPWCPKCKEKGRAIDPDVTSRRQTIYSCDVIAGAFSKAAFCSGAEINSSAF